MTIESATGPWDCLCDGCGIARSHSELWRRSAPVEQQTITISTACQYSWHKLAKLPYRMFQLVFGALCSTHTILGGHRNRAVCQALCSTHMSCSLSVVYHYQDINTHCRWTSSCSWRTVTMYQPNNVELSCRTLHVAATQSHWPGCMAPNADCTHTPCTLLDGFAAPAARLRHP